MKEPTREDLDRLLTSYRSFYMAKSHKPDKRLKLSLSIRHPVFGADRIYDIIAKDKKFIEWLGAWKCGLSPTVYSLVGGTALDYLLAKEDK